jgi:hypothetical protein
MLDGAVALRGQLDEHGAAVLQSALAPLIKPLGPGDARTARQRRADALVELIAKAAADGHAGVENAAGLPPTLVVHVDVEQLADPSASALGVVAGGAQDADGAAPGCSDASQRPGGVVQRLATPGAADRPRRPRQRLRVPRLRQAPGWTDAHHVIPWRTGGRTDLDNLILLCRHHHRLVHEGGWTAASRHDDRLEYRDPNGILYGSTLMPRSRGG